MKRKLPSPLIFLSPDKHHFTLNYDGVGCGEEDFLKEIDLFPEPQEFESYDRYARAAELWYLKYKELIGTHILPIPVSFSFRIPVPPHVPTPQEKIHMSDAFIIATKSFNPMHSPLYPDNHLHLQQICRKGSPISLETNFPEKGPRGQEIKIKYHVVQEVPWNAAMIPQRPEPNLYLTHEDYSQACRKWYEIAKKSVKTLPVHPSAMENQLNIASIATENFNSTYRKKKSGIRRRTTMEQNFSMFCLDPPSSLEKLGNMIRDLTVITREHEGYKSEFKSPLLDKNDVPDIQTMQLSRSKFCESFYPQFGKVSVMPKMQLVEMLKGNVKMLSPITRYSLYSSLMELFNDPIESRKIMFLNDPNNFYQVMLLVQEFGAARFHVFEPKFDAVEKSQVNSQDKPWIVQIHNELLKYNYHVSILQHFQTNSTKYAEGIRVFKTNLHVTEELLKKFIMEKAGILISFFTKSINVSIATSMVNMILLLCQFYEPKCTFFTEFAKGVDNHHNFITFLKKLATISPKDFNSLANEILLSTKNVRHIFPIICSYIELVAIKEFSSLPLQLVRFIISLYMINPSSMQFLTPLPVHFISNMVQVLSDSDKEFYSLMIVLCRYIKHCAYSFPGQIPSLGQQVMQTLSMLISLLEVASTDALRLTVLDCMFEMISLQESIDFIQGCESSFSYLVGLIQNENINGEIQVRSWKVLIKLFEKHLDYVVNISAQNSNFLRESFLNLMMTIPDDLSYHILRLFTQIGIKNKIDDPMYFDCLLAGRQISPDLVKFYPDYATKSLKIMRKIQFHADEMNLPYHYFVKNRISDLMNKKKDDNKLSKTEKNKRRPYFSMGTTGK